MPTVYQRPNQHQPLSSTKTDSTDDYLEHTPPTVRTLLTWKAPMRPFRKKDVSFYRTVIILVALISLIALLLGQLLLIGVLLAVTFVVYVLNFIPPEDLDYKLSTQGVTIGDHFYLWQELDSFWFAEKEGHPVLSILTNFHYPSMLMLMLGNISQEEVKQICAEFLPFHEIPPKSFIDKWGETLQKHFQLESPKKKA